VGKRGIFNVTAEATSLVQDLDQTQRASLVVEAEVIDRRTGRRNPQERGLPQASQGALSLSLSRELRRKRRRVRRGSRLLKWLKEEIKLLS